MNYIKNILFLLLVPFTSVFAQIDLSTKQIIDDIIIYQDYNDTSLYYYAPQGLKLMTDDDGKPVFKFIQMRYTGTHAAGDQGDYRFKSLLYFKVSQHTPKKAKLDSIKTILINNGALIKDFKSITISNLKAKLVHAADEIIDSTKTISGGFFEEATTNTENTNWKERDFTMRLNNHDSQIFWEGFKSHQPTISVNYSFHTKAYSKTADSIAASGSEEFIETFEANLKENNSTKISLKEVVINAGAIPITIDTELWPDLIKKVDINQQIPPDYAVLDIYCFDFNNELRLDLYAKRVEIKATSVGGKKVTIKKTFKYNTPEVFAQTTQFIYAVKLSEPYQYRITEIFHDGNYNRTDWITKSSWNKILDITTKSEN